ERSQPPSQDQGVSMTGQDALSSLESLMKEWRGRGFWHPEEGHEVIGVSLRDLDELEPIIQQLKDSMAAMGPTDDEARAMLHDALVEVESLRAERERYREALGYISTPTMGRPGD